MPYYDGGYATNLPDTIVDAVHVNMIRPQKPFVRMTSDQGVKPRRLQPIL